MLVTQMDVFNRLLGTTQINLREWSWALVPAIALLGLWELGKLIARRRAGAAASPASQPPPPSAASPPLPRQRASNVSPDLPLA